MALDCFRNQGSYLKVLEEVSGSLIGSFLASITIEDAVYGSGSKILRLSLFQSVFLALFWLMGSSSMSKIIFFGYNVF